LINFGYDRCTAKEKAIVDYMLNSKPNFGKPTRQNIADHFGVKVHTVIRHLRNLYDAYGIDSEIFSPQVRLVYLRAKELGLI
jgi:DNA-binding CsgD family transcriptional regulator